MSDVFLSYAREDESLAHRLAAALEARGWSVWWDRRIPHGKDFSDYIQQQLDVARCIVVLWSKASVTSPFVRDEATEGLNDGRLVPVLIEETKQPLGFRQLQAANLSDWQDGSDHAEFDRLVMSIGAIVPPDKAVPAIALNTGSSVIEAASATVHQLARVPTEAVTVTSSSHDAAEYVPEAGIAERVLGKWTSLDAQETLTFHVLDYVWKIGTITISGNYRKSSSDKRALILEAPRLKVTVRLEGDTSAGETLTLTGPNRSVLPEPRTFRRAPVTASAAQRSAATPTRSRDQGSIESTWVSLDGSETLVLKAGNFDWHATNHHVKGQYVESFDRETLVFKWSPPHPSGLHRTEARIQREGQILELKIAADHIGVADTPLRGGTHIFFRRR